MTILTKGPYYVNEDCHVLYTVKIEDRKHMKSWDWIGVFRVKYFIKKEFHGFIFLLILG